MDDVHATDTGSRATAPAMAVIYAAFLVFLVVAACRQGLSHFNASVAFRSGLESDLATAAWYESQNPYAYRTAAEVRMRDKDFGGSAAASEKMIELRGGDYLSWLQLGYARQQLGEFEAAAEAYQRSIALAPNYSRPRYYMGLLLLDADQDEEAFKHLTKAAQLDPVLAPSVMRLARKSFDDPREFEAALNPATASAKRSVARYLIKHNYMTDSIRSFLLSDELTVDQKNEFVAYLLHKRNYQLAREIWLTRPDLVETTDEGKIFDGGFERIAGSDPSGLGWQIDAKISDVALTRDRNDVHSGQNSLNIRFSGNVDLQRPIIAQLAYVVPGSRYSLSFFAVSTDTVSAGLPAVIVADAYSNKTIASSVPLVDTKGAWREYKIDFTAPDAGVVLISLQRPSCSASPCPIFGELSLDDMLLR